MGHAPEIAMAQHRAAEYIDGVMQQWGPGALPYAETSKKMVRDQLLELQNVGWVARIENWGALVLARGAAR